MDRYGISGSSSRSFRSENRSSASSQSFRSSDAEDAPFFKSPALPRKLRNKSKLMYPLRKISNNGVNLSRHSLRSLSGHLPSPDSSDCEPPTIALTKPKSRIGSTALPTPPTTDDEKEEETASQTSQHVVTNGYPFPLQPVSLPSKRENTLPPTPDRRCFSARNRRKPISPFPDRFVSNRSTPTTTQSPAETYRLSKIPHQLTPEEKMLRNRSATLDPFGPLRVSRIRADRLSSSRERVVNGHRRSHSRTIGFATVSEVAMDAVMLQNRQASAGNVWNVGGSAQTNRPAPVRGVSDGRGGFLSSGSNAPMYESNFLDDLSTDQDVVQMEQRIAVAMDIDRTTRVLDNTAPLGDPRSVSTGSIGLKRKRLFLEPGTTFKYGAWTHDSGGKTPPLPL